MTDRPGILRQPLAQSLALSLGIHLALLGLVRPWPAGNAPQTLVINARLASPSQPETPPDMTAAEPPPPPSAEEAPQPPSPTPPLLSVPKPAPIPAPETPPPSPQPTLPPPQGMATVETREASATPPPATVTPSTEESGGTPILSVPIDTNWYLARQVDRHPKAIGTITPKYPDLARQRGQEGSLKLMVKIDDLGRVRDVEVVEAHPPGVFDEAALEAFRDARFQPAMKDGRPVRYQAYIRVEFRLE